MLLALTYILVTCVVVFATLLHHLEKVLCFLVIVSRRYSPLIHISIASTSSTPGQNNPAMADQWSMGYRYRSIPSSLWYTTVHLTGDYPLYQYTPAGKIVNAMIIIAAVGLVAVPMGLIAEGLQSVLEENRSRTAFRGDWNGNLDRKKISLTDAFAAVESIRDRCVPNFRSRRKRIAERGGIDCWSQDPEWK